MNKETLESYISMREEIRELQEKLDHLSGDDSLIDNSVIYDYRTGFPRPQAVVGFDSDKYWRRKERYTTRIKKLQEDCTAVEEFIENIPDSLTRRIFRMVFIEGKTQKEVGKVVHMDRSSISRRIDKFIR